MAHVHGAASAANAGKAAVASTVHGMTGMLTKGVAATGAAAAAGSHSLKVVTGRILNHPLIMFGLGLTLGYAIHKYRKEIIGSANRVAERGKDFVLQQRENLEDLIAEGPDSEA